VGNGAATVGSAIWIQVEMDFDISVTYFDFAELLRLFNFLL